MNAPREIGQTGVYIETNLSANAIMGKCHDILRLFNYSENALSLEYAS
jgi:hypothetical protein